VVDLGPTSDFNSVTLDLAHIITGTRFGRIYHERYPNPLGYGKTLSRFSDPRTGRGNRFGVLYVGESLNVCFLEAILRDQRNGFVGDYPMAETELRARHYVEIEATMPLNLIDLRGNGPVRMGVPSDVAGRQDQSLARVWSLAFYQHPSKPDGIIYPSRLNGETNLAIYGRAVRKLGIATTSLLLNAPGLPQILDNLKVALV
jgi:hypothetical protein